MYCFDVSYLNKNVESICMNITEKLKDNVTFCDKKKKHFLNYYKLTCLQRKKEKLIPSLNGKDDYTGLEKMDGDIKRLLQNVTFYENRFGDNYQTGFSRKSALSGEVDRGEMDRGEMEGGEMEGGETDGSETDGSETDGSETDGSEAGATTLSKCSIGKGKKFDFKKNDKKEGTQLKSSFSFSTDYGILTRTPEQVDQFMKREKQTDYVNDIFSKNIYGKDLLYDYIYRRKHFLYSYMCIYIFLKNGMIFFLRRNLMSNENMMKQTGDYNSSGKIILITLCEKIYENNGVTLVSRLDNMYYNHSLFCDMRFGEKGKYGGQAKCGEDEYGIMDRRMNSDTFDKGSSINLVDGNGQTNEDTCDDLVDIQKRGMKNMYTHMDIFNLYDFSLSKMLASEETHSKQNGAACEEDADGEDADGEDADGEDADGEEADGEEADGEEADGEEADGEEADGEEADEEEGTHHGRDIKRSRNSHIFSENKAAEGTRQKDEGNQNSSFFVDANSCADQTKNRSLTEKREDKRNHLSSLMDMNKLKKVNLNNGRYGRNVKRNDNEKNAPSMVHSCRTVNNYFPGIWDISDIQEGAGTLRTQLECTHKNVYVKTVKYLEGQIKNSILIMNRSNFLRYIYIYFKFLAEHLDTARLQQSYQFFIKTVMYHTQKYFTDFPIYLENVKEPHWADTSALLCLNVHFFFLVLFLYHNFVYPVYKYIVQCNKGMNSPKYDSFFHFFAETQKCILQVQKIVNRNFRQMASE
ncbi:WD domain G-beta repeat domain containing protein [Plasmodium ovale wallikeri]|uniref:WD domain G-beta repeat domain containing protein n=1 Tax=Plasmodium ovale wallikeri TaxID=864142 RepID=A0A1A8ZZA1_PLAOA|nr:WD domain G-beta repeat domain containing protein [Plasmodium ovale wallikeri]